MASAKLARVRWYVGQTLLPDHLEAQEDAALAELCLAARMAGLPWWGVSRLAWNATQLAGGIAAPSELTVVMRGGAIVDVPSNARLVAPLILDPATRRTRVHLHLLEGTEPADRAAPYDDDPPAVDRVLQRVVLSPDAALSGAVDSLPLGELERRHDGWAVAAGYVPPLLQVSPAHPYREPLLGACESLLVVLENKLVLRLTSSEHHHHHELAAARHCLTEVQRALARLDDVSQGIHPHPYVLYALLRDTYFAICAYAEAVADRDAAPYRHDALAATFAALTGELRLRLASADSHLTERPFVRGDGLHVLAPLPDGIDAAREVYLLVRAEPPAARELVESIKLAARSRLATVHRRVLQGVPLHHVGETPFHHPFGPDVDFYLLGRNTEWDLALRDGSLAFHDPPGLDCRASLFWR